VEVVPRLNELVFFKLQLVLFFEDIRSERLLMRHAADRLSVRWYIGVRHVTQGSILLRRKELEGGSLGQELTLRRKATGTTASS